MSDSVKKYFEEPKEHLLDPEERRENDILELIALATKSGKIAQVTERAAEVCYDTSTQRRHQFRSSR